MDDLWALLSIGALFALALALTRRKARLPLPPRAPPPRPGQRPWEAYAAHGSGLLTTGAAHAPIVVVNTAPAAAALLHGANFATRPRWPMAELLGRQDNVGFQYYGASLKRARRAMHGPLGGAAVEGVWAPLLETWADAIVRGIREGGEDGWYDAVLEGVEGLVVQLTYGHAPDAAYLALSKRVMHETNAALRPGVWAVNTYPILKYVPAWMPGAGFQRWARDAKAAFYKLTREPFEAVKREMAEGTAPPSFVRTALDGAHTKQDEDAAMHAAGSLFSAGTDTMAHAILTALHLLTHHPRLLARLHTELAALPAGHPPALHERSSLPYLTAVISESLRTHPPIPLAHKGNINEAIYEDVRVPPRSWVLANIWAMLHDPAVYAAPAKFDPGRFMDEEGAVDPRGWVYGFGRRRCPGAHLADAFVWLAVARVVAAFDFHVPREEEGKEWDGRIECVAGLVPMPKRWRCVFVPRGEGTGRGDEATM